MGKMKELAMYLDDFFKLLSSIAKDVHVIADYIRDKQEIENKTIRKQIRNEKDRWGKLI